MKTVAKRPFESLSFSRQFLLLGAVLVLLAMALFGRWLGHQIESGVTKRAAEISASYVEGILTAHLRSWPASGALSAETHEALDRVFVAGTLHRQVLGFKLWTRDGIIIYSGDHAQIGRRFPVEAMLAAAFEGLVQSRIETPEDWREPDMPLQAGKHQLEIYVPVRTSADGKVTAVAEFDHAMEALDEDIRASQYRGWGLTAICALLMYALMYSRVRMASDTILEQQRALREQLQQLRAAFDENRAMRERLSEAGAQTTTLSEQFLNRVAADLHDGPAQELAYALLRFDDLAVECGGCKSVDCGASRELDTIHQALHISLEELRGIASGLCVPGVSELTLAETARRALRDAERQAASPAITEVDDTLGQASLALKITLYRLIRESLANCRRHAPAVVPKVSVLRCADDLLVSIQDQGPGFEPAKALASGRLGLIFMRERVRLAGGVFEINSAPGQGTTIRARIPLVASGNAHSIDREA